MSTEIFENEECKACCGMGYRHYMGDEECSICDGIGRKVSDEASSLVELIDRVIMRREARKRHLP